MASILKKIFNVLNADLTGRSWHKEVVHPYFQSLTYFGHKDPTKCYWEAELTIPGSQDRVGVTMQGTSQGPTAAEEAFCRSVLADLDRLFQICRPAFEPEFSSWTKQSLPSEWRAAFKLEGFSVPSRGEPIEKWEVTYLVESAGHSFTALIESGKAQGVQVDG